MMEVGEEMPGHRISLKDTDMLDVLTPNEGTKSRVPATSCTDGPIQAVQGCSTRTLFLQQEHTYKLTRGGTGPDGVKMTLIRE